MNFAQLMYKQGLSSGTKSELPVVLGVEGAGNVCEVGDGVDTFKVSNCILISVINKAFTKINIIFNVYDFPKWICFFSLLSVCLSLFTITKMH